MPYLQTSWTHEPSHTPPPDSQPIRFSLLPTSGIYTLFTLVVASPIILIAVKGLPSYQADLTCQLLVQLLHLVSLAQIQHFRACPNDLPSNLGLPLRATLSLLVGPILELLHTHSFHRHLEELPSEVLFPAFRQVYLTLSRAEQQHYRGQTGLHTSPSPVPLALQISSRPASPAPTPVNNEPTRDDPIRIQIAKANGLPPRPLVSLSNAPALAPPPPSVTFVQILVTMGCSAPCTHALLVRKLHQVMQHIIVWQPNVISVVDGDTPTKYVTFGSVEGATTQGTWSITALSTCLTNQMLDRLMGEPTLTTTTSTPLWRTTKKVRYVKPGARVYEGGNVTISFLSHVFFLVYLVHHPYFCFTLSYKEVDLYLLACLSYSNPFIVPL